MHSKDDYDAKLTMWAKNPEFPPMPEMEPLPGFKSAKFSSYAEMNAWKRKMLMEIAERGGVKWKK